MPKHTFQDKSSTSELLPIGDYKFAVIGVEFGISKGQRTNGSDNMELKLQIEDHGTVVYETLTFHTSIDWKIDTFLKASGAAPQKGEPVDFCEEFLIGLRGWCTLFHDEYNGKKKNKVAAFITSKPLLPRLEPLVEDDAF